MRRFANRGLCAALESENVPAENEVLPEAAESLETELLDVQDSQVEGEDQAAQVDDAVEVTEALEAYAVGLESIVGQGGLDRNGAMMMNIGLESLYARVGLDTTKSSSPALESFGGTSTRVRSSQLALEDIKDKIKEIWDSIIKAMKKAYEWVKGHFLKVFGASEKLEARAKKIKAAADGVRSKKKKESTFTDESLAKNVYVGNSIPDSGKKSAEDINTILKDYMSKANEVIKNGDDVVTGIENPSNFKINFGTIGSLSTTTVRAYSDPGKDMQYLVSNELIAGKGVVARKPVRGKTDGVDGLNLIGKCKAGIAALDPDAKAPSPTTLKTMDAADIEAIATSVESIAQELNSFRKISEKLDEVLKKGIAAAEKAGKEAESEENAAKKAELNAAKSAATGLANVVVAPYVSVTGFALSSSKYLLDWCEKSLANYEAK